MTADTVRRGLKSLLYCHSVPDPELATRIIDTLLKEGRLSIKDISKRLDVSYPLVLRIVNDMASMGILDTDRVKPEGRGRSRKVVFVNKDGLLKLIDDCLGTLTRLREQIDKGVDTESSL
ncbi:MAG: winged helix-turn-helix domain-containing protein [Desulfurococcales archaeon]|nr:winged helix-turn-helix domain-containing protein [Desulfurococcales archaeon]MCE4605602.1 winged helix-turn-helix domain-containing protein [Desulfurococcales archaeon]